MKLKTLLLLTAMTATMSFATGCGKDKTDNTDGTPDATNEEGHGHEHAEGDFPVAVVELEGRTIEIGLDGALEAGKEYHCHASLSGGDVDKIRVWIGEASGDGSLKSVVEGVGSDHMFVNLVAPADIAGVLLGVEIEIGDDTFTGTSAFGHDHDGDGHDDHEGHDHDGDGHDDHEGHDHDGDGHDDHDHDHGDHDDHDH